MRRIYYTIRHYLKLIFNKHYRNLHIARGIALEKWNQEINKGVAKALFDDPTKPKRG